MITAVCLEYLFLDASIVYITNTPLKCMFMLVHTYVPIVHVWMSAVQLMDRIFSMRAHLLLATISFGSNEFHCTTARQNATSMAIVFTFSLESLDICSTKMAACLRLFLLLLSLCCFVAVLIVLYFILFCCVFFFLQYTDFCLFLR